jgi:hypothetical protein
LFFINATPNGLTRRWRPRLVAVYLRAGADVPIMDSDDDPPASHYALSRHEANLLAD